MNKKPSKILIIVSLVGLLILSCMEVTIYLENLDKTPQKLVLTEYGVNSKMTDAMVLITIVVLVIIFTIYLISSVIRYNKKLLIIPIILIVSIPLVLGIIQPTKAYQEWQEASNRYQEYMEKVNKRLEEG